MKEFIDYYAIFGIPPTASVEEIKKAYRKLAIKYHPDRNSGLSEAEKKALESKLKEINKIKDILLNPETKKEYDREYFAHQSTAEQLKAEQEKLAREAQRMRQEQEQRAKQYAEEQRARAEQARKYRQAGYQDNGYREYGSEHTPTSESVWTEPQEQYEMPTDTNNDHYYTERSFYSRQGVYRRQKRRVFFTVTGLLVVLVGYNIIPYLFTPQPTVDDTTDITTEIEDPTITVIRYYTVGTGDTLSELAEDANCTQEEIEDRNNLGKILYSGQEIEIPYHIPQSELAEYTTSDIYNQGQSLEDFATIHETTVDSIISLNEDTIIETDEGYAILSDTLQVPTFQPYNYESTRTK